MQLKESVCVCVCIKPLISRYLSERIFPLFLMQSTIYSINTQAMAAVICEYW